MSGLPPFLAFMGDTQLTKKKKTLENKTTRKTFSSRTRTLDSLSLGLLQIGVSDFTGKIWVIWRGGRTGRFDCI